MKKILVSIMIVSLIFSLNAGAYKGTEAEILFSETFEGDLSRWTISGKRNAFIESLDDKTGHKYDEYITHFLKIWPTSDTSNICVVTSLPFEVEENIYYTFAVDAKSVGGFYMEFLDENNNVMEDVTTEKSYTSSSDWETSFGVGRVPANAKYARVCLTGSGNMGTYASFDNVIVCKGMVSFNKKFERRKTNSPLAVDNSETVLQKEGNVLLFEGFEKELDKWELLDSKSKKLVEVSKTKSYMGAQALQIESGKIESAKLQGPLLSVVPGGKYELTFMARNLEKRTTVVSLIFQDSEGNRLSKEDINTSVEDKTWKKYIKNFVVPDKANKLRINIIFSSAMGASYIDDIKLCEDLSGIDQNEIEFSKLYNSSMVLLLDSPNVLVNGEKMLIDKDNRSVCAKTVNSKTLVPVRFIAENFGAEVEWEGETETVTLKMTDKTVVIKLNDKEIKINDEVEVTDVPAQTLQGRTMLPLRFFAETVMGKYVHWDDAGLIVITDDKNDFLENNKAAVDKLIENVK